MWNISKQNSQVTNRNLGRIKTLLMYFFLIWEQKINICRVIENLSAYTVTWEKLPKFVPDESPPAQKRFETSVYLETNWRIVSYVHQPAVVKVLIVALVEWGNICKSLLHWRLYFPSVLLMASWAHPLTPIGILCLPGWETHEAGCCDSQSIPWFAALGKTLPGDDRSAV